ncbi:MAG TPA: cytochrome c [Stellaceae bacterium]|nr:cytochrome c [Stellaceae bacterium]
MNHRLTFLTLALVAALASQGGEASAETPVERGAYLVNGIAACGNCHAPRGPDDVLPGPDLSGGPAIESPVFSAYPTNITPALKTGLGGWTDEAIVAAIREGRRPDGRVLRPPMPVAFYRSLSDTDAGAIAAYLRSVPAVENQVPDSRYKIPAPTGYGPPLGAVPDVAVGDKLAYGSYLAQLGHCLECHTPVGAGGQRDYAHRSGAGGMELAGVWGRIASSNITPDRATGIGAWSDREIKVALSTGIRPDGAQLAAPMPWYYFKTMKDADLDALVVWMRSLQPVVNKVR